MILRRFQPSSRRAFALQLIERTASAFAAFPIEVDSPSEADASWPLGYIGMPGCRFASWFEKPVKYAPSAALGPRPSVRSDTSVCRSLKVGRFVR